MIGDLAAYGSERESCDFPKSAFQSPIECRFDSHAAAYLQVRHRVAEPREATAASVETEFPPDNPPERQHRRGVQ